MDASRRRRRRTGWLLVGLTLVAAAAVGVAVGARSARAREAALLELELAKDPGLGVRALHAEGVTGAGVQVAIIDWQIRADHVEYADRLAHVEELDDFAGVPHQAHGPAMASLLVGRSVGVAPGASLHYFALPLSAPPERLAGAIGRVVERNETLPPDERVRLLSVSTGFRDDASGAIVGAVRRALERGVFVLMSNYPLDYLRPPLAIRGLGCDPGLDCDRPANFGASPGEASHWEDAGESVAQVFARRQAHDDAAGYRSLYAPANRRTVAGPDHALHYEFDAEGGDSMWAPYLTGVLALALQVSPELTTDGLALLLAEGASERPDGVRLIDPARVVELARR